MNFLKRIFLFLVLNVLVVTAISIVLNLLNIRPYLQAHGLDLNALLSFCLVWGMGGAFISLALSRLMARWLLGVQIINPNTHDAEHSQLVATVYALAQAAGLPKMPQVGIYTSAEANAFATGPSKRRSLVAVSSGLLQKMSQQELEGVLAHEISHIANGDMVTMTLLQGVVNAFVMFLARVLAYAVSGLGKNREGSSRSSYATYSIFVFVFEIAFMLLGWMVIACFSRYREYRADAGGAHLAGKQSMISALQSLKRLQLQRDVPSEKLALQAFKISNKSSMGLMRLFATHPPLELRIERLQERA